MTSLDALLGVVDEEPPKTKKEQPLESSISQIALDKLKEAEAGREAAKASSSPSSSSTQSESALDDQFKRIIIKAKKLAQEQKKDGGLGSGGSLEKEQAALKREFDAMLQQLNAEAAEATLTKDQIKQLKEAAFGPLSFWITETKPIQVRPRARRSFTPSLLPLCY